jgi:hypothetical protein
MTKKVMPGNPASPYPNSQQPYARVTNEQGQYLNRYGAPAQTEEEAHIPLNELPSLPEVFFGE